jgi:hypothetical protein
MPLLTHCDIIYHYETHYPGLTTWARALLKSDTVRNVFYNSA